MSVLRYIESLTLANTPVTDFDQPQLFEPTAVFRGVTPEPPTAPSPVVPASPIPDDLKAAVDVGSLLSFVAGVSAEEKDDVLFSVQLAQRAASGEFDRFGQTENWYRKYLEVLEAVGWATEQFAFSEYAQSEGEFRMDKAALAIVTAIATQNQLAVLTEAIHALESLAEGDGTIRLFDLHSAAQASGNFQIGAVQKAGNEALSMALGAFHFRSNDARRRFLFFAWGAKDVAFWTSAKKLTLNTDLYAGLRTAVKEKLGVAARNYIGGLNLQ
jgi:hypothetical protein